MIENNTSEGSPRVRHVQVAAGALALNGALSIPHHARGIVLLAQGSRNIEHIDDHSTIAEVVYQAGMATLHVHLLTDEEERLDQETQFFRLNVSILHQRIIGITEWLINTPETRNLAVGYFATGVTGAAALIAAAERPDPVHAVVVGSARIDLAQAYLARILAPTCLIVGAGDSSALKMNQEALEQLTTNVEANKRLESIAGTTNLFETPEILQKVAGLAGQWFTRHLEPIV